MAEIKSRYPRELSDTDYDEWFTRWVAWFLAFPNTPEFANWLRSGLYALDAAFHDALVAVGLAKIAQDNATELWNESVKNLRDLLVKLRISLPTLTPGDDSVLDTLNLRGEVPPRDADDLVHYAELVDEAWQPLSGDPAYAPFADRLNLIAPSLTDINDKRVVMGQAILAYSTACDVKTAAREECNTRERAVFNFFRGEDKPPEFWTSSPYGLPGGGEGGGEEPGPESWEDEVANLVVVEGVGHAASIRGDVHPDADGVAIFLAEGPMGDGTVPVRPVDPIEPKVPSLPFDMPVAFNVRVWLWVCHVKDGAWGAITGPVWIEVIK